MRELHRVLVLSLWVVAIMVSGCVDGASSSGQDATRRNLSQNQTPESTEYKLAVVDAGGYVKPDDIVVSRFRSLLSQLSVRWGQPPTRLADMSVVVKKQLQQFGIDQNIIGFMEGMNLITPVPGKGFPEYASFYVIVRNQGQSHNLAIAALQIAKSSDFPR